jgi:hypothetical protein
MAIGKKLTRDIFVRKK